MFEKKLHKLQYRILLASFNYSFFSIRHSQKILTNSLPARLASVQTTFKNLYLIYNYNCNKFFTSKDKLRVAINLKSQSFNINSVLLHVLKNPGLSSFHSYNFIHEESYNYLCELACLPFVESYIDKFSFGFRPFRSSQDSYFKLKKIFSYNKKLSHSLIINIDFYFNHLNKFWLLKNFPFNKQQLSRWVDSFLGSDMSNIFHKMDVWESTNLLSTFFNFTVSGLVRSRKNCWWF